MAEQFQLSFSITVAIRPSMRLKPTKAMRLTVGLPLVLKKIPSKDFRVKVGLRASRRQNICIDKTVAVVAKATLNEVHRDKKKLFKWREGVGYRVNQDASVNGLEQGGIKRDGLMGIIQRLGL